MMQSEDKSIAEAKVFHLAFMHVDGFLSINNPNVGHWITLINPKRIGEKGKTAAYSFASFH